MKAIFRGIAVSTLFLVSCTIWSQGQWREVSDKTFRLTSFVYSNKAADREFAFKFMKSFPVREISALFEKRYGIVLDDTEFMSFLADRDNYRNLEADGVFSFARFAWTSRMPSVQACELEFEITREDEGTEWHKSWTVRLLAGGKVRLVLTDLLEDGETVPHSLGGRLGIGTL
jgi:hypothetical protein